MNVFASSALIGLVCVLTWSCGPSSSSMLAENVRPDAFEAIFRLGDAVNPLEEGASFGVAHNMGSGEGWAVGVGPMTSHPSNVPGYLINTSPRDVPASENCQMGVEVEFEIRDCFPVEGGVCNESLRVADFMHREVHVAVVARNAQGQEIVLADQKFTNDYLPRGNHFFFAAQCPNGLNGVRVQIFGIKPTWALAGSGEKPAIAERLGQQFSIQIGGGFPRPNRGGFWYVMNQREVSVYRAAIRDSGR